MCLKMFIFVALGLVCFSRVIIAAPLPPPYIPGGAAFAHVNGEAGSRMGHGIAQKIPLMTPMLSPILSSAMKQPYALLGGVLGGFSGTKFNPYFIPNYSQANRNAYVGRCVGYGMIKNLFGKLGPLGAPMTNMLAPINGNVFGFLGRMLGSMTDLFTNGRF